MKVLDYLATAAAVGVFGYFVWKVIVPKLGDLQLPSWQPPQFPEQQQTPQLPSTPSTPTPSTPSPSPPTAEEDDEADEEKSDTPAPPATIGPAPAAAGLLYDSNTMGKWNNGQKRTVTASEGGQGPDGKGMQTAASGNPTFTIDGNGVGHLTSSKYGRIYIYAKNYNARLEGELMFETIHLPGDDISFKIRSRHGHSPDKHPVGGSGCPCGGIGAAYGADGSIDMKAESCHGTNPKMGGGSAPKPQVGQWHKFSFSVWDAADGSIQSKFELDGKVVGTGKYANPVPNCKGKALFDTDSYFWIRLNSADKKTPIKAAFRNIRLYNLGSGGTASIRQLMIDEPYLFNGYYGRRRL